MPIDSPWIYTSSLHPSLTGDGKRKTPPGIHAIFAAQVPFLPSFLSADFVGPVASGLSRLQLIGERQIRFVNDLAGIKLRHATFDLRLLFNRSREEENVQPTISILFLGKVFVPGPEQEEAGKAALELWRQFASHFPLEDPFNYPLIPVNETWLEKRDRNCGVASRSNREAFEKHVLTPIPLDSITDSHLSEIRKFEDSDSLIGATLGVPSPDSSNDWLRLGYFAHPFHPTLDVSGFSRLMETIAQQDQSCLVRISLRPTRLSEVEVTLLSRLLSEYESQIEDTSGWIKLYKEDHLRRMQEAFQRLITHRRHLFSTNIQVVGERHRPRQVVAALGSEFMNNQSDQPQKIWEVRPRPGTNDIDVAKANLRYLEHKVWGDDSGGASKLSRMPILVSGYEAAGAFRLPIPPESGYMPGIPVRDEPFVQPKSSRSTADERIDLGSVLHRGTVSSNVFGLSLRDLRRHILVAGSTGSGKTITCLHLLSQLWGEHGVPFLVIYPVAKPDYRLLMADPVVRDDLLIFTAGDRPSPFQFNPFDVPEHVLLQTHLSNMMRTFSAGMHMWGPLPMLFREALRDLYRDHGWKIDARSGDDPEQQTPTLADFYHKLKTLAGKWSGQYRADLRGDLRQDSEAKIRDLLETTGTVLNVSHERGKPSLLEQILEKPTVIELGRVGAAQDIALVVGFLVTLLSEHVFSRHQKNKQALQHVTLIEEAHRLMSAQVAVQGEHVADPRMAGAEDFAHILSEVRGFGEAIIIAEQTPTKLIPDAVANTHIKIMHKLEDRNSFELFSQLTNLNERQRQHAHTLEPGEAIVRTESGYPVLVKVPFYEAQVRERMKKAGWTTSTPQGKGTEGFSTDDEQVQIFMEEQIRRHNLSLSDSEPWHDEPEPKPVAVSNREPPPIDSATQSESKHSTDPRIEQAREERMKRTSERLGKD
ncbi:MAG: ATP-binding protein [bacterium]|nr:ATP-binding protein [bacterium]